MTKEIPIACVPGAIAPEEREEWQQLVRQVYGLAQEVSELEHGYALRLPSDSLVLAARHVSMDRRCCPFLTWTLVIEPAGGPVWLRIEGPAGGKDFVRAFLETTDLLPEAVALAAGLKLAPMSDQRVRSLLEQEQVTIADLDPGSRSC